MPFRNLLPKSKFFHYLIKSRLLKFRANNIQGEELVSTKFLHFHQEGDWNRKLLNKKGCGCNGYVKFCNSSRIRSSAEDN